MREDEKYDWGWKRNQAIRKNNRFNKENIEHWDGSSEDYIHKTPLNFTQAGLGKTEFLNAGELFISLNKIIADKLISVILF